MIHIVTSKWLDIEGLRRDIAARQRPGYVLLDLAENLPVRFQMPGADSRVTAADRIRARLFSTPELWALARWVVAEAGPSDTIFATGEDVGIPLAAACRARRESARLVVTAHNLDRPRGRWALRLFRASRGIKFWVTPAQTQADFLVNRMGVPPEQVRVLPEQTDTSFYVPASAPVQKRRPIIVSVGLEQRDYRTLAAATEDLPVDVRISGFSKDARALHNAFPDPLPANMSRKFYEWTELVELYQSADIVVVPLFPNAYVAGITTFLEALACRRPLIVTRTEGLAAYCDIPGTCLTVPPSNPLALRTTIQHLLNSPPTAEQLAARGHEWLLQNHTAELWVAAVIKTLTST